MVATCTGAERVIQTVVEHGIKVCFANPGIIGTHHVYRILGLWNRSCYLRHYFRWE